MDSKGYETKPWWPYVKNLQDQISGGGSGGGGDIASIVVTLDTNTMNASCVATRADILSAAKSPRIDLIINDPEGNMMDVYRMIPCVLDELAGAENDFRRALFYNLTANMISTPPSLETASILDLTFSTFEIIPAEKKATLCLKFVLMIDANQTAISHANPATSVVVSMPNM